MSDGEPEAGACASVRGPRTGVDLARGLALLGLMAAGAFRAAPGNGLSALGPMSAGDCPAVAFALVAGVSLALTSGGCRIPDRRHRACARAEVAVQAVLIAAIGLALGFRDAVPVVLPYYGVLVLITTLFLGRRPWFLVRFAAVVLLITPIMVASTLDSSVPRLQGNPTFSTVVADPSGLLIDVFVTGPYPVLIYLASICTGLAIGRMDLSSAELTRGVLIGGLAVVAVSWVWWLAFPASRSHGWVYLIRSINSLGSAVVMLAVAILLVRTRATECLLRPFTAVGTMVLTLYCGFVVVLATGALGRSPAEQYPVLLVGALLFAVLWRRFLADGPLEFLVAQLSCRARHAVLAAGRKEPE
ncbi:DUF418 domain-containing protein [Pseudonocardia sp. CA-142604]|uniref:DUF418 domain-containing protein n=1 Tax=Pseudonocardia sp. CA-142604 TaxID=3240024 RepID=UPI003D908B9A